MERMRRNGICFLLQDRTNLCPRLGSKCHQADGILRCIPLLVHLCLRFLPVEAQAGKGNEAILRLSRFSQVNRSEVMDISKLKLCYLENFP